MSTTNKRLARNNKFTAWTINAALVLTGIVVMMAIASGLAYTDAVKEQSHYCQMVKEKAWPDYKKIYKKACTAETM